jgi:hypothetical protein
VKNYSSIPLITCQIMTYDGDVHLLPRMTESIAKQDLDHKEIEVQIVYDGRAEGDHLQHLNKALDPLREEFPRVMVYEWDEQIGYYTVPRNRVLGNALGYYLIHGDADNEYRHDHFSSLLEAVTTPLGDEGIPHFAYSSREYVHDKGADPKLTKGASPFVPWKSEYVARLQRSPKANFVDTGDFIVARSVLYRLADLTGYVWNSEARRFGDHDLIARMAGCGFRGRATGKVTHVYHWTGKNLQVTRWVSDTATIPVSVWEDLKAKGKVKA